MFALWFGGRRSQIPTEQRGREEGEERSEKIKKREGMKRDVEWQI
jgi:hypothetical protein